MMDTLNNDILIKIITTIAENKDKQIKELHNKLKKANYDLEKEKLKITNIKDKTAFNFDYFCCDFCCDIYNMDETSVLYNVIEPYICKYCEKNPIYTEDILNAFTFYRIDNIININERYDYNNYNDLPKRYTTNPIFTIIKYYYDDLDKLIEDKNDGMDLINHMKKNIIQEGLDLSLDYRYDETFVSLLKQQRRKILNTNYNRC